MKGLRTELLTEHQKKVNKIIAEDINHRQVRKRGRLDFLMPTASEIKLNFPLNSSYLTIYSNEQGTDTSAHFLMQKKKVLQNKRASQHVSSQFFVCINEWGVILLSSTEREENIFGFSFLTSVIKYFIIITTKKTARRRRRAHKKRIVLK